MLNAPVAACERQSSEYSEPHVLVTSVRVEVGATSRADRGVYLNDDGTSVTEVLRVGMFSVCGLKSVIMTMGRNENAPVHGEIDGPEAYPKTATNGSTSSPRTGDLPFVLSIVEGP